jgi:hypothetical protein
MQLHHQQCPRVFVQALSELGYELEELYEEEQDAGLGNGGVSSLLVCVRARARARSSLRPCSSLFPLVLLACL